MTAPASETLASTPTQLSRPHRSRLMQIWRSAGWPCKDALEIDLLAAGLVVLHVSHEGNETLRLTDAGVRMLAEARRNSARALSTHDRLAHKFAEHLLAAGRIVWRELSLRAVVDPPASPASLLPPKLSSPVQEPAALPPTTAASGSLFFSEDTPASRASANIWRMARPDLFSVRNTTVPAYLHPMVHEVKVSRADLLSDLRHDAKRQAYQWLCEECYYVFPAGVAEAHEIPDHFGIWVLHGGLAEGRFELVRPARHARCTLPFAVWMALCKATPMRSEAELAQAQLGEPVASGPPIGENPAPRPAAP